MTTDGYLDVPDTVLDLLRGPLEIICEIVCDENLWVKFENPIVGVTRRLPSRYCVFIAKNVYDGLDSSFIFFDFFFFLCKPRGAVVTPTHPDLLDSHGLYHAVNTLYRISRPHVYGGFGIDHIAFSRDNDKSR